jgi:hypothetical protein
VAVRFKSYLDLPDKCPDEDRLGKNGCEKVWKTFQTEKGRKTACMAS